MAYCLNCGNTYLSEKLHHCRATQGAEVPMKLFTPAEVNGERDEAQGQVGDLNIAWLQSQAEVKSLRGQVAALQAAFKAVEQHLEELRVAWERGCISEHDGLGGTRSNRNTDLLGQLRQAASNPTVANRCDMEDGYDNGEPWPERVALRAELERAAVTK